MAGNKVNNLADQAAMYNDDFIKSISLTDIKSNKDLKSLVNKLESANEAVTEFYQTLYNDFIMSINNSNGQFNELEYNNIKKYKSFANKLQKAYSYILYLFTFDNPFKPVK